MDLSISQIDTYCAPVILDSSDIQLLDEDTNHVHHQTVVQPETHMAANNLHTILTRTTAAKYQRMK